MPRTPTIVRSSGSRGGASSVTDRKLSFPALMATFDQLSAEQRAILELVLQRGQSYDALAGMLSMKEERVRELAHDALVHLAPVTAPKVEDDWRGQIADYILGQQSGPESTATRGHLRRSEQARAWAGSLLDSLETLYGERALPSIPTGLTGARPPRRRGRRCRQRELSPEARSALARRRRLAHRRRGLPRRCAADRVRLAGGRADRRRRRRREQPGGHGAPTAPAGGQRHPRRDRHRRRPQRRAPGDRAGGRPAAQPPARGLRGLALQQPRATPSRSAPRSPTARAATRGPGRCPRTSRTTSSSTSRASRSTTTASTPASRCCAASSAICASARRTPRGTRPSSSAAPCSPRRRD